MPLLLFIGFIIICLTVSHTVNHTKKLEDTANDAFWEKEQKGNFVRAQSTEDLVRITLPDDLPYEEDCDEELAPIMKKIIPLKEAEIINLTGITNTDLKLKYGLPNLEYLMECDGNFTNMVVYLNKWADYLISHLRIDDAVKVLEFAVSCHADVGNIYINLAKIYIDRNEASKVNHLIEVCSSLNSLSSNLTVDKLKALLP